MRPDKNTAAVWPMLVLLLVLAGCGERTSSEAALSTNSLTNYRAGYDGDLDLGEGWDEGPEASIAGSSVVDSTLREVDSRPRETAAPYWTVLLRTFSGPESRRSGATMVKTCVRIDPKLADARVHHIDEGAMVIYGHYAEATGDDAQAGLAWIKGLQFGGRPVFPRAMLTRIVADPGNRRYSALELMSIRARYPNVEPLYTLQVGIWGDFGGGRLSDEQIRHEAEAHARRLRVEGLEAYVHHDSDKQLSTVTIGLFDHTALDPQTGFIVDPALELLKQRHPHNLVNGEPLREPIDSRRPGAGTRIQASRLVLVPKR